MTDHLQKRNGNSLPYSAFSAEWIWQHESQAAEWAGVSLYQLMERAGKTAFEFAKKRYPTAKHWLIACGKGNNGGDGYVVARLAKRAGIHVTLLASANSVSRQPKEAERAKAAWLNDGGEILAFNEDWSAEVDLIIDGLFGIGLHTAPAEPYATLIRRLNADPSPIIALDIPSGLNANTGLAEGDVIYASHTISFIALKIGLLTGQARDVVGQLHYDDLGLSTWLAEQKSGLARLTVNQLSTWLRPRRPCSHKGDNGRLLVIGGDYGMAGAIRMAAEGALRSGAGLVRVLTRADHLMVLLAARPELMAQALTEESLFNGLNWADVVLIGPGLGQQAWAQKALNQVRQSDKPMLWDADALNLLAIQADKRQNRIITPHPGEAARLLGCSVAEIESDRLHSAKRLTECYGGTVVLKGAGTVIIEGNERAIADVGNPGMASGGMGDILSGIIAGLMAQKLPLYPAACMGCVVHGAAADSVVERHGTRGLLATDLLPEIQRWVNPYDLDCNN